MVTERTKKLKEDKKMQEQNKKPQTTHGSEQNEETNIVLPIDKGRVKDSILLLKTYEQHCK